MANKRKSNGAPKKQKQPKSKGNSSRSGRVGSMVGSMLGSLVSPGFAPIGAALGSKAQQLFSKITGMGDYKVRKNSLVTDSVPQFATNNRTSRIVHREFVTDVSSSSAFSSRSFSVNPGMAQTFPWLYSVAQNYSEYKIHGLIFEYKSTSADALNSTNTALGTVILATQYNVLDGAFVAKQQMENTEFVVSVKPSLSVIHPIECDPSETPVSHLYIRSGAPSSGDLRLYDWCNFTIATVGSQAAAVIGELWVSYDIEFLKPKLGANTNLTDHYVLPNNISSSQPFGVTLPVASSTSNFGTVIGTNSITFPKTFSGYVQLTYTYVGASGTCVLPTLTASGGCAGLAIMNGNNSYGLKSDGSTETMPVTTWTFSVQNGGTITFGSQTMLGSITAGDLFINTMAASN